MKEKDVCSSSASVFQMMKEFTYARLVMKLEKHLAPRASPLLSAAKAVLLAVPLMVSRAKPAVFMPPIISLYDVISDVIGRVVILVVRRSFLAAIKFEICYLTKYLPDRFENSLMATSYTNNLNIFHLCFYSN